MRLFQNSGLYPAYRQQFDRLAANAVTFKERLDIFLADRYGAAHFLQPVLEQDPSAFFTNADDEVLQRQWAKENGLSADATHEAILLSQIENHRTEVFYNMDPMRYGSDFVRKLPGCVRKTLAWRAAPSPGADFAAYDLMLCNFPRILESYRKRGWRAHYFSPAYDPEMGAYAVNTDRPIDVLFVGGYSRHHRRRAQVLEAVAGLRQSTNVVYHLDRSRLTRLAESSLGHLLPLAAHRRPADIQAVSHDPVFGRDLYAAISRAKIVLNGAVDMAGLDRGNMRCFEAMGCGALMVSDEGNYPAGMVSDQTMLTFSDSRQAMSIIADVLQEPKRLHEVANRGLQTLREHYSKARQWQAFVNLLDDA